MLFGCCVAALDQLATLEAAGCDYCELPIARLLMAHGGDRDITDLVERLTASPVKPRAYNVFLPPELPVTGSSVKRDELDRYVRTAFTRVRRLGGAVVVFGSGPSRSVPDRFDRPRALDQLEEFLRWTGALAAEEGIVLALEPLRRAESNVFNSVREGGAFLRQRRLDGVHLLADLYHMMEEVEPLSALDDCAERLAHVHVADTGRQPPGQGGYDLVGFFEHLRRAGYRGACSIECTWADFPRQFPGSLDYVRRAARTAGW